MSPSVYITDTIIYRYANDIDKLHSMLTAPEISANCTKLYSECNDIVQSNKSTTEQKKLLKEAISTHHKNLMKR
jgi:hypothetical protein